MIRPSGALSVALSLRRSEHVKTCEEGIRRSETILSLTALMVLPLSKSSSTTITFLFLNLEGLRTLFAAKRRSNDDQTTIKRDEGVESEIDAM